MGIIYKLYLDSIESSFYSHRIFQCGDCGTHLSTVDEIISKVLNLSAINHTRTLESMGAIFPRLYEMQRISSYQRSVPIGYQ